jgi:hypothetical protein
MIDPGWLRVLLRLAGLTLLLLAGLHVVFWRVFDWGGQARRLSPLNARVFVAHVGFVCYVLLALGLLLAARPDLLVERSALGRLVLAGLTAFFVLRLLVQIVVFDPVLARGSRGGAALRLLASLLWLAHALVFAAALVHQLEPAPLAHVRFDWTAHRTWVRLAVAAVWLVFGLAFKAFDLVPRHRRIVSRVVGAGLAGPVTALVALGESALGLWMLSGLWLPACMSVQTLALVSMNVLELRLARDLLLAPRAMILANLILLGAGWYVALG